MIGLPRRAVRLSSYENQWRELYAQEERLLIRTIGELVISLQHIGSTAIPGLCAKPVIDIAAGVEDLSVSELCIQPLATIGYTYRGEAGVPERHFFVKGSEACRTHYLHVEKINGANWENHIFFRDYLRSHPDVADRYAALKKSLADKFPYDRDAYTDGKNAFIEAAIEDASNLFQLDALGRAREKT